MKGVKVESSNFVLLKVRSAIAVECGNEIRSQAVMQLASRTLKMHLNKLPLSDTKLHSKHLNDNQVVKGIWSTTAAWKASVQLSVTK